MFILVVGMKTARNVSAQESPGTNISTHPLGMVNGGTNRHETTWIMDLVLQHPKQLMPSFLVGEGHQMNTSRNRETTNDSSESGIEGRNVPTFACFARTCFW